MIRYNLSKWAIDHRSFVSYVMIAFLLAGAWAYYKIGRNEDPSFTIKTMVVQAAWPGATISDTANELTDRLERKLQETPSLEYVRSYTTAGRSTILVTLKPETPASRVPEIWYEVRKKIDDIRPTLPQGVIGPGFNDEFGDTYGIIYAFTADGFTTRELRDYVEKVRARLLNVPNVQKIGTFGAQDERIYIEFSVHQLAGLNVDRLALLRALQAQNAVTMAGVVQTQGEKITMQVSGGFRTEEDIRRINFTLKNQLFRLSDIATVRRGYADPAQPIFRSNGVTAIGLGIAMRSGGDILTLGRDTQRAVAEVMADFPIGIEAKLVAAQPQTVSLAVNAFMVGLAAAIAIVLVVSFLSLGLRAGAVVACSIPLVLAISFLFMGYAGIDLQRVSLGALIISLGLLVDDAMITVESMATRLEQGDDKREAVTFAYSSTAFPMLTGTLVTIIGFVPVGFAQSTAGEYSFSLFVVIAVTMIASWFVAVFFAPLFGVLLLSEKAGSSHAEDEGPVLRRFRTILLFAMRRRWPTIGATLSLLALAAIGLSLVPQQLFPASDRPDLMVDLKLTQSASIFATDEASKKLDAILKGDPDIDHWSSYTGSGAPRFYLPMVVQLPNDFIAQTVIVAKSLAARERIRGKLDRLLPDQFPETIARVYPLELGPPVGWPVQYRVSGPDVAEVRHIAYQVADLLAAEPNARTVNFDWIETGKVLRIKVDQDQAAILGLNSEELARALNTVISGQTITQVRDGIYLVDVVVRASEQDRLSIGTLQTLQIPLPGGGTAPLSQFASLEYDRDWPLIWRRDRLPTLTVQSDVARGVEPDVVVKSLASKIATLRATLPSGYDIAVGGIVEESDKAMGSVLLVVPAMILAMLTILMVQLQSFNRLFLVMSVAPLGLIGVVPTLLLFGKPLGFVALLGVLALIGMTVRNAVILIDQIDVEIARGRTGWDAVVQASLRRLRPILLTASAAILGMIPIAPTVFWGPMAYAIMGGLAIATVLTLLFFPALYVTWYRLPETPLAE
jgi:multidrug efflux pump subunit AcrB